MWGDEQADGGSNNKTQVDDYVHMQVAAEAEKKARAKARKNEVKTINQKLAPAVHVADAGASYNPTAADHKRLLQKR